MFLFLKRLIHLRAKSKALSTNIDARIIFINIGIFSSPAAGKKFR